MIFRLEEYLKSEGKSDEVLENMLNIWMDKKREELTSKRRICLHIYCVLKKEYEFEDIEYQTIKVMQIFFPQLTLSFVI